eukprot:31182-Chlamydomonas_euryale.AAC.1
MASCVVAPADRSASQGLAHAADSPAQAYAADALPSAGPGRVLLFGEGAGVALRASAALLRAERAPQWESPQSLCDRERGGCQAGVNVSPTFIRPSQLQLLQLLVGCMPIQQAGNDRHASRGTLVQPRPPPRPDFGPFPAPHRRAARRRSAHHGRSAAAAAGLAARPVRPKAQPVSLARAHIITTPPGSTRLMAPRAGHRRRACRASPRTPVIRDDVARVVGAGRAAGAAGHQSQAVRHHGARTGCGGARRTRSTAPSCAPRGAPGRAVAGRRRAKGVVARYHQRNRPRARATRLLLLGGCSGNTLQVGTQWAPFYRSFGTLPYHPPPQNERREGGGTDRSGQHWRPCVESLPRMGCAERNRGGGASFHAWHVQKGTEEEGHPSTHGMCRGNGGGRGSSHAWD